MADLDDFFAKKDRKKSKGKKFLTADELVKNLEDTSKREPAKAKKEPTPAAAGAGAGTDAANAANSAASENNENPAAAEQVASNSAPPPPVEEEWKEIEVERKDYSGLKIGQLTINEDEMNNQKDETENYDDEDNEGNENLQLFDSKGNGPWKKVIPAEEVTQIPMPVGPATGTSVYISPALRHSQNSSSLRMNKLRKGIAPDITNEDYFPTLGAARPEEQKKKKNEPAFEEVRHGGRVQRVQEQTAAPVSVGNRFKSLEDDDS
ncbi:protein CDV3 homolog [Eupeodes corollae]|uniref:protein CDV3 homolog n=1 Tax=Eupeodes corollae TaxID=290404 RepID=UPI0024928F52|nr:protein CDV3 homolog [Eupeodes corollae]